MAVYYNEHDAFAAAWLRELARDGQIPAGDVDERDVRDVLPSDLAGYDHVHLFAGIGGWALALDMAGWPSDRPVWTGSCPCQPFSAAGRGLGAADERHLWPAWRDLIRACRPPIVFGEQVASAAVIGKGSRVPSRLQASKSCARSFAPRQNESGQEGLAFRPDGVFAEPAGQDRRRHVRGDGPSFQPEGWQDVGQPLDRQDRAGEGLRLLKRADRAARREQRLGRLGRAASFADRACDDGAAQGPFERAIEAHRRELEEATEWAWIDAVSADLEREGYACGASAAPACGVGAPHIRQRLWWVANANEGQRGRITDRKGRVCDGASSRRQQGDGQSQCGGAADRLGDAGGARGRRHPGTVFGAQGESAGEWSRVGREPDEPVDADGVGVSSGVRWPRFGAQSAYGELGQAGQGLWSDLEWLPCRDGKDRPAQPGIQPLAHGVPNRVGTLRGAGNAIVSQVAAEFIKACS